LSPPVNVVIAVFMSSLCVFVRCMTQKLGMDFGETLWEYWKVMTNHWDFSDDLV